MSLRSKEQSLLQKAKDHKQKLISLRQQKLQVLRKKFKEDLSSQIQLSYDEFKKLIDEYYEQQMENLKLERDLKINDIQSVQDSINTAIDQLKQHDRHLQETEADITNCARQAIQYLQVGLETSRQELDSKMQAEVRERVAQYAQSIFIQ